MKRHVGIVLKRIYSRPHAFSIFDRHDGKMVCFARDLELPLGSLVSFFISKPVCRRVITGVRVLDVPLSVARNDIFFLHHVLELCYYSLPAHGVATEVFDLVAILYTCPRRFISVLNKNFFLFKLLVSFGLYHDHAPFSPATFSWLSSESIDSIAHSALHLEIERNMDKWLFLAVEAHPQRDNFKTVKFLKNRLL